MATYCRSASFTCLSDSRTAVLVSPDPGDQPKTGHVRDCVDSPSGPAQAKFRNGRRRPFNASRSMPKLPSAVSTNRRLSGLVAQRRVVRRTSSTSSFDPVGDSSAKGSEQASDDDFAGSNGSDSDEPSSRSLNYHSSFVSSGSLGDEIA